MGRISSTNLEHPRKADMVVVVGIEAFLDKLYDDYLAYLAL